MHDSPDSACDSLTMHSRISRVVAPIAFGAFLVVGSGCGDDSKPQKSSSTSEASAPVGAAPHVKLGISGAVAGTPLGEVALPPEVLAAVLKPVGQWAQASVVDAFATRTAGSTDGVFDGEAAIQAASDAAVLEDEGLPEVTGPVTITAQQANVTAIGDPAQPGAVGVNVVLGLKATVSGGTMESTRLAEFVLKNIGGWKIVAYDVSVKRTGPGVEAKQRATSSSTPSETTSKAGQ